MLTCHSLPHPTTTTHTPCRLNQISEQAAAGQPMDGFGAGRSMGGEGPVVSFSAAIAHQPSCTASAMSGGV